MIPFSSSPRRGPNQSLVLMLGVTASSGERRLPGLQVTGTLWMLLWVGLICANALSHMFNICVVLSTHVTPQHLPDYERPWKEESRIEI